MSIKQSTLPKGWVFSCLSDLLNLIIGGDWGKDPSHEDTDYVDVKCIRSVEVKLWSQEKGMSAADRKIKSSSLATRQLMEGDIVLEVSGGGPEQPVGRTILIDREAISKNPNTPKVCTNFFRLLRPTNQIDSKFLNTYLDYFYKCGDIASYQAGSNNLRNLKVPEYIKIQIPVPPLNEQKRIVAKIEELFSELECGIESLKTAREQLKVYRQAVLKHAFEGKLTTPWREKNKDKLESADQLLARIEKAREIDYKKKLENWKKGLADKPKKIHTTSTFSAQELADLSALPKSWQWVRWEDILDFDAGGFKRGPFGSALKKEFFVKHSKYKVYEQYCPINDDCSFERYYITEEKFKELEGFAVKAHDFLISCSGVTLGRITQVPEEFKEGIINQALLRVRLNKDAYDFAFFKQLFRSRYFQKRIFENSTGTAIPNVKGVGELKAIAVPLCSLAEQKQVIQEIEKCFSVIDKMQSDVDENLQKSEALRQSILKKAFSGQLVAQNPADEPASLLLERIRTEKATSKPTAKKPKEKRRAA